MNAEILGMGLCGPGLKDWNVGSTILASHVPYTHEETEVPQLASVPARNQRRHSPIVRLALAVAEQAVAQSEINPKEMSAVFGWPHGNNSMLQTLFEVLATKDRFVSPTDFHNCVHNAAVGYWAIHTGCQRPCTSVSAEIHTFAAALLKAVVQMEDQDQPVLLTVTDAPYEEPLNSACPIGEPFAMAMVLSPRASGSALATVDIGRGDRAAEQPRPPALEAFHHLWKINAAARALPFLERVASGADGSLYLPYGPVRGLDVTVIF